MLRSSAAVAVVPEVMRRRGTVRTLTSGLLAVVVVFSVLVMAARPAHASTFTVNQVGDQADANLANAACDVNASQRGNQCTLRAAIQEANDTPNSGGSDLIKFSIASNGPHTIKPTSQLPAITQAVTIDGYTEGDATATIDDDAKENTLAKGTNAVLKIELDGTNLPEETGLGINASNTTVRGLVINRFGRGIQVFGTNNIIEGNFVGTDITGTQDLFGNVQFGVFITGTSGNVVGGTTPEDRNLISGNGDEGVVVQNDATTGTKVQGNLIGTEANGTSPLGNGRHGVFILEADKTVVGGTGASAPNTIAFNGRDGVSAQDGKDVFSGDIFAAEANKVQRNSIFSNGGLGIDLVPEGSGENIFTDVPTANDGGTANDSDTGANGVQNKPTLTSAVTSGGTTTIEGVLDTKPNTTFTVEFFSQPNGNEGKKFIGQKQVPTDADGRVTFNFSPANAVAVGQEITATATGPEGTSEFSAPREVTAS